MTENIIIMTMYPSQRPQKTWRSRTRCWNWIKKVYKEVVEIIPDDGYDSGVRELAEIKGYHMFCNRIREKDKKRHLVHFKLTTANDTAHLMTFRIMPVE